MKTRFMSSLSTVLSDRPMLLLLISLVVAGIAYILYAIISLSPSELQIATHYSAFGDTHYYRNRWYYTISFVAFAVILLITHVALAIKMYTEDLRMLAIAFGWFSIALIAICAVITGSVLGMAA